MKKRFLALATIATMILATACAKSTPNAKPTEADTNTTITETNSMPGETADTIVSTDEPSSNNPLDSVGDIEVNDDGDYVTIIIPADMVGDTTQADLDATAQEKGWKSATLNADGTASYVMTKKQHEQMLNEYADQLNASLAEIPGSEGLETITKVEVNDNFTVFTVTTTSEELTLSEAFSTMSFYMMGGMYAIFSGESVDNIKVVYVNASTGAVISEANSSEMGE